MGEAATPAQSAAASGTFVPMLGVGLGAMPGPTSRGSAVPQLHNAIVERLRARIELCRRHHSTCENRYQRGQAETSEREHESTLHLLNIVQQGPGNRKAKGSRGGSNNHQQQQQQPPPDYSRANGDMKGSEDGQKISTRIALQGSLRRKLEGHAPSHVQKQNGVACGFPGPDFKRSRMDPSNLLHGPCHHNNNLTQSHSMQGSSTMAAMQRKNYSMMPHGVGTDIFNMTLKEMKKEPIEIQSCGQSNADMIFDFKEEGNQIQIDPDLQDLFDELTKTVPTLNDLELEKMLKQDDTFGLDLGRPNSAGAAASLCSPMDKPIKLEVHSPDYGQVHCNSPQLRPASAGPSFTLASTNATTTSQKGNAQAGHQRATMPCWPEISHAEQLKQMAANQQQPSSMLHHHHQANPTGGLNSWAPAMTTHSSTNAFNQDKVSSPGQLSQQRIGPQTKGINNCLFKSNGHNGSHHLDMKVLSIKPQLHFSPKAPHSTGQPMAGIMANNSINKTSAQQQVTSGQNPPHSGTLHFQNQQMGQSGALCLQPKAGPGPGLPFKLAQQRQCVPPGPRLPTNLGVMSGQTQPRQPAPSNQQKGPLKTQAMHRQLNQQQHNISNSDKDSAHDQFSRHLTRPPPDYKQPRGLVGVQQGNIYTGPAPSQSCSSVPDSELQSLSCHLPGGTVPKMNPSINPSPSDRRFSMGPECHPNPCIGQFQQQHNQTRMGLNPNQNKARFLGPPNALANTFSMNNVASVQHSRTPAEMHNSGVPGQGMGGLMKNVNMGWGSANKQVPTGLNVRRLPNPMQPQDMPTHPYQQQRHIGPPNQVAPDIGMLPINPSMRDIGPPRPNQAMMRSQTNLGNLNQASPEQRVPANSFAEPNASGASVSSYQSNRANRLTFDFLPEGDNTVPGINTDSDFIDSLLKSGSGNDDWMKDINLDEILGGHS